MFKFSKCAFGLAGVWFVIFAMGCGPATDSGASSSSSSNGETHVDDGHHHDEHAVGPNKGHLVHLHPHDLQAEWLHHEDGTVTVIILDEAGKKEVAIATDRVIIETDAVEYPLDAIEPTQDDPPKASRFETKNELLMTAINVEGKAKLRFTVGETEFEGEIEHHDHEHHAH